MTTQYDSDEVLVGGATDVYVSDPGVAFPNSTGASIGAGWTHLGYTTEAGVKPGLKRTIQDIRASQSFYPVRQVVTSIETTIDFELEQWNSDSVLLALGGGVITAVGGGDFKYFPPDEAAIDERQLLLHTVDGDRIYRWGYSRVINTRDFSADFTRTNASVLPIGMKVLDPGTALPFFFLTNDPAFAAAS
jgi:hypothetical protein